MLQSSVDMFLLLLLPASQVLYRLQPDSRSSAIGYITNLSDSVNDRTLKVCVIDGGRGNYTIIEGLVVC